MGWNLARVQSYIVRGSFYAALPIYISYTFRDTTVVVSLKL